MNRLLQQRLVASNRLFLRNFQKSSRVMSGGSIFGTPKEGVYSNIPFKIKQRVVPLSIVYWGTLGFFFSFPFLTTLWHLKKSGSI